jgi:SAM-dependent methyltransferase
MRILNDIKLPLYKNDGAPLFIYKKSIKEAVERVISKIKSGFYKHIENKCLCGNSNPENDVLIAEKDMWGVPLESVICSKCGLVRSKFILDNNSLSDFYETDYKNVYYDSQKPDEAFFNSQSKRGKTYFDLIEKCIGVNEIINVFDYGCGLGGTLMPFKNIGKAVSGCDYGMDYIEFGNQKGLNLYHGELNKSQTPNNSQDLVIVSHVMEHLTNPIESMQNIIDLITPGKYLLVEVPGLYAENPYNFYPVWHLQKGHIYNFFYKDFLMEFFMTLGLEVIYSDERCTFICKKPIDYSRKQVKIIYSPKLKEYPQKNLDYFINSYIKFDSKKWKNRIRIAKFILRTADLFKLRYPLGLVIKDSKTWIS